MQNIEEVTMQIIEFANLQNIITNILLKLDFSSKDASSLAEHLATANLLGHHSHGIIRLPIYYQRIKESIADPRAKTTHEDISPSIAFVDGNRAFGQLASIYAANLAIEKAKTAGLAAVGINNIDHTGRLGAYVQQIADANMLGMYFCNGHSGIRMQAPYGGKDSILSANPFALAAPRKNLPAIVLDMATTAIAHGKVMSAKNRDENVPEDCLLDKDGNPTCNPLDYFDGGSLLPFGGKQAYKGFGLALFVEIFAGILSRARMLSTKRRQDKNGGFILAINIENFLPLEMYFEEIDALCNDLKASQVRQGFTEVLLPGERSNKIAAKQKEQGIEIAQQTWDDIVSLAKKLDINI